MLLKPTGPTGSNANRNSMKMKIRTEGSFESLGSSDYAGPFVDYLICFRLRKEGQGRMIWGWAIEYWRIPILFLALPPKFQYSQNILVNIYISNFNFLIIIFTFQTYIVILKCLIHHFLYFSKFTINIKKSWKLQI